MIADKSAVDSSAVSARLIGAIFVEKGLVTDEQLELALEQQRATGDRLGEILVDQFGVERLDLASALAEQWAEYERQGNAEERELQAEKRDLVAVSDERRESAVTPTPSVKRPIGEIFVERGLVSEEQLEDALAQQKATGTRLGEILVASGRLSRLELASALADQWATFQKLRPPAAEAPVSSGDADADGPVLPTPEVVASQPVQAAAAAEITSRVDALAARIDQIADQKIDWKPQVEKSAELLRARMEQLEEQLLARQAGAGADDLRSELAALAERIEQIPAPSEEWRLELAQVAENLRTRIERVEQLGAADQFTELRASLDGLAQRLDSLPAPSEEWRDAIAELAGRIDTVPAPSEEWREQIAALQATVARIQDGAAQQGNTGGGNEELRASFEALVERVESMPAPSDEWRTEIEAIRRQVEQGSAAPDAALAELRASLDALSGQVAALPWPSEDLREQLNDLTARVDVMAEAMLMPSDEWREQVADLAARVDSLPVDAWRPELAEVAENLRTRVERVEHGLKSALPSEEMATLRSSLAALAAQVESLPVSSDEWREAVAQLAGRIETMPAPSEEWRDLIADLSGRVDTLRTDEWKPELAEVAENLRTRVERVEQGLRGATAGDEVAELRSTLDNLVARVESLPLSEDWRDLIADLSGRLDALRTDEWKPELAEVAESLRNRVDRIEQGMVGQARAAAVTEIAQQVDELARKVSDTDVNVLEAKLQALGAQIDALPGSTDAWREPLAQLTARIDGLPVASDEWREQIAELVARVDTLPLDQWRPELAQVAENLRTRVETVERELAGSHAEQFDGLRSEIAALTTRIDTAPEVSDEIRAQLAGLTQDFHTRAERFEQRLASRVTSDALEGVVARIDELVTRVNEVGDRHDAADVERDLAGRLDTALGRLDATESTLTDLRTGLDALPASVEARLATAETRAVALSQQAASDVESVRRELDDLRALVAAGGEASANRVDDMAAALRAELVVATEQFAGNDTVNELRSTIEDQATRIDGLGGELVKFERYVGDKAAGHTAGLSALRARLETVESALAEATGWSHAVETLELRLVETSASEAVERNTEIEGLRVALSERVAALESSQLKRKDLRELRNELERVERRVDDRKTEDDAATRAVEEAVREGLADLGERLTATEATYLDAGRALRRSIEGLGSAISGADAHLTGVIPASVADARQATSYVAFAPTPEGYRLVACEGGAPALGGNVEIPEYEGQLVVTRVGSSPLPFDARPCVYLEHA